SFQHQQRQRQQETRAYLKTQWAEKVIRSQNQQCGVKANRTRLENVANAVEPQSTTAAPSSLTQKYIGDTQRFVSALLDVLIQIPRHARKDMFELNYTQKVARLHRQ